MTTSIKGEAVTDLWKSMKKESIIQYKMRVEIAGQQGLGGRQTAVPQPGLMGLSQDDKSNAMIQDSSIERSQTGV